MDEQAIRRVLVDALEIGGVAAIHEPAIRDPFLAGTADITLERLEMDSLAKMELCIAVEVETGVSLTPDDLLAYATLGQLVQQIGRQAGRG
ncbi:phosphopantetheine binding protein [Stella humosa]|uniref:Phosphopantetheine binding protein n=1 Tax=Stella humosa TaxID=94 RepID=A0A3N1LCL6_9PROT|nr:acyl carrier protein [Stella humosa]ROP90781.1 phosphopantetheine binding protein [Stella humosa]BBK34873.1 hypothetical protein STHU_55070 [Stella humosa]